MASTPRQGPLISTFPSTTQHFALMSHLNIKALNSVQSMCALS